MTEPTPNPGPPRPRQDKACEDPHYHDEEPEIVADDQPASDSRRVRNKPMRRLPPPRRRYLDD